MNVDPANSEAQVNPEDDFTQFRVDGFINVNALLQKKRELKKKYTESDGAQSESEEY